MNVPQTPVMSQERAINVPNVAHSKQDKVPVHHITGGLLNRCVVVHLAGCGGTGSQLLPHLARLHKAMKALGHPAGLHVTVFDPDTVTSANIGRQMYSDADVGRLKAEISVHRINAYCGTVWHAVPGRYEVVGCHPQAPPCDILITCLDTARVRRQIAVELMHQPGRAPIYWLDCGNEQVSGQVYLTEARFPIAMQTVGVRVPKRRDAILPPIWAVLPELFDESIPEDNRPSCSLAEALGEQSLMINSHMAGYAATLLSTLFREGKLEHHGYWINLENRDPVRGVSVPSPTAQPARTLKEVATNG